MNKTKVVTVKEIIGTFIAGGIFALNLLNTILIVKDYRRDLIIRKVEERTKREECLKNRPIARRVIENTPEMLHHKNAKKYGVNRTIKQ